MIVGENPKNPKSPPKTPSSRRHNHYPNDDELIDKLVNMYKLKKIHYFTALFHPYFLMSFISFCNSKIVKKIILGGPEIYGGT